jgi:PucR family transcriptional regulator, purine catabolism regulatory protein
MTEPATNVETMGALPTLREIFDSASFSRWDPVVITGRELLDRHVRWVHVNELERPERFVRGGELLLTTGTGWPDRADDRADMVRALADGGIAALCLEVVRRFDITPPEVVRAAETYGLVLVEFRSEVSFVEMTVAVQELIIGAQVAELRISEEAHRIFTDMSVRGASVDDVLKEVADITGQPVVFENLSHQVLAYASSGMRDAELLERWEAISRAVQDSTDGWQQPWLVVPVEARGERFGRLVAPVGTRRGQSIVLERAATTVALNSLVEREHITIERRAHGDILHAILRGPSISADWLNRRAAALGVPLSGRRILPVVIMLNRAEATIGSLDTPHREHGEWVATAWRELGVPALVGPLDVNAIGVLASVPTSADPDVTLRDFAVRIEQKFRNNGSIGTIVGAGTPLWSLERVQRSLMEARHAAEAVWEQNIDLDRHYYRIEDVGVRGFVHLMRDDSRLQLFVERMLSKLMEHDRRTNGDLIGVLNAYLCCCGVKSAAADSFGLSRPSFYARLTRLRDILQLDLDDADVRTSLHLALVALSAIRDSPTGRP